MALLPHLLAGLRKNICASFDGQPSDRHVDGLVRTAHVLAVAALRSKRTNRLLVVDDSLEDSDLAYDCISELFRRDDGNMYVRSRVYFNSFVLESLLDEDLLVYLRWLVWSSVNQGLFRVYGDLDPSLGKILRNAKIAVDSLGWLAEVERLGEQCVAPAIGERLERLPVIELDELQTELALCSDGNESIPEIMAAFSKSVPLQKMSTRVVPIVRLALAIRWLYSIKQLPPHNIHRSLP